MKKKRIVHVFLLAAGLIVGLILLFFYFGKQDSFKISRFQENSFNKKFIALNDQHELFRENFTYLEDNRLPSFERVYFPEGSDIGYYFGQREYVVLEKDFTLKEVVTVDHFATENNCYFGEILKRSSNKIWLAVEIMDPQNPRTVIYPDQIIEVAFRDIRPELRFHNVDKFTSAAVNDIAEVVYLFRNDKAYYDVYDFKNEQFADKRHIKDFGEYYIGQANFNSLNNLIMIVASRKSKSFCGIISDNSLETFKLSWDTTSCIWGADGNIYYNSGSNLLRYNPQKKAKEVILSAGLLVKPGPLQSLSSQQKGEVLIFNSTFGTLFSRDITFGSLYLDLVESEYSSEIYGLGKPER